MQTNPLFSGVSPAQRQQLLGCLRAEIRSFQRGETILTYAAVPTTVAILLTGAAHLYYLDADGSYTLLEQFGENGLFGELFLPPTGALSCLVEADTTCQVLFLPYDGLLRRCERACAHHSQVVSNLRQMTARRAQSLALHLSFVSKKTVRQRLQAYLEYMREQAGASTFRLDHSLRWLADYLCVDRTSLMRELRYLRDCGAVQTNGRWVTFSSAPLASRPTG